MKEHRFIPAMIVVVYVLSAMSVENLFPLSTFPMYSDSSFDSGARLVAVDSRGEASEVSEFEDWSCPELVPVVRVSCPDGDHAQPAGYLAEEAIEHIQTHSGEGDETVELVVRAWRLATPDGQTRVVDCPVTTCAATRR